jgi:poly(3-hydroxybutyrate) depolymerase
MRANPCERKQTVRSAGDTMKRVYPLIAIPFAVVSSLGACSPADDPGLPNTGGSSSGSGGAGGSGKGGLGSIGGTPTSGAATGGAATSGAATGGSATGGAATAGAATGGATTGGAATGGATTGGTTTGGSTTGGGSGAGGSGPGGSLSAGCGKPPTIPSSMYNNGNPISIMAANRQRRYILSVPANYDNSKPYNLVIAWHQLDGNDKQMYQQNYYWLKDIPEAASSTIFVAPNGEKSNTPCTGTGNGESGCGWPDSSGSNVALGDAVVEQIEQNFCIDKNKIFANGWSYGGSMSYRTACSRPLGAAGSTWGVRAVAIYNGAAQLSIGNCTPSKGVAFYASHGTNDTVLQYDGGVSMAQTYAKLNSCNWMTPAKATGNHICTTVAGCMTGYPVEFCSFVGPHTPDPPREGGNRWQPQEVWKFFSAL